MKWLFLPIVFIAAIASGFIVAKDPGYALFVYQHWTVQMPLWLVLLFIVLLFVFAHVVIRILNGIFSFKNSAKNWWRWHHYRQTADDIKKRVTKYVRIRQLMAANEYEEAEKKLRKILKRDLNDEALWLYQSMNILTEKRYKYALRWQNENPNHPALLALLGKLANELKLWGLARKYYAASLELSFVPEVSLQYADFLLAQNEKDLAMTYYRKGLLIASSQDFP